MKKILISIVLLLIWSTPVLAQRYTSGFGFTVEIPDYWLVMTRNELKANPDLFSFEHSAFEGVDREMMKQVESMVRAGKIEVYFNENTSSKSFNDNINVYRQEGRPAVTAEFSRQACGALPGELSRMFGRQIKMYDCGLRTVAGRKAFYADFDGVVEGTRSVQYQVEQSPGVAVIFTLTTQTGTLSENRREFDNIVGSLRAE